MMKFKVGDSVITTQTYRRQGTVMFYEDKRGTIVKVGGKDMYRVRFMPHGGNCPCCHAGAKEIYVPGVYLDAATYTEEDRGLKVGQRVRVTRSVYSKNSVGRKERIAYSGDVGTILEERPSRFSREQDFIVKFDPTLPFGPNGVMLGYREGLVRRIDLVRLVLADIGEAKTHHGRMKAMREIIDQRERSRARSIEEYTDRCERMQRIMAIGLGHSGLLPKAIEKLVQEGFLTEQEVDLVSLALEEDLKVMEYPWSHLPHKYQRLLLTAGTYEQAVTRVLRESALGSGDMSKEGESRQRRLLRAVAIWGRAQRRMVQVSERSQETLFRVAVERAALGLSPCHWNHLSAPGATAIGFGEGIVFRWDSLAADSGNYVMSFGAPRGVFFDEHLEIVRWHLGPAPAQWWERGYSHVWKQVDAPYYVRRRDFDDEVARAIRGVREEAQKAGTPVTQRAAAEVVLALPYFRLVHMTVNLIAALHNFHHDVVKKDKEKNKARKKKSRKARLSLAAVLQINLDDDGLHTWSATWCQDSANRERDSAGGGTTGVLVGLHQREAHVWKPWIRRDRTSPTEKVFATKTRTTKKDGEVEYCQVERPRKGCWAGSGDLKPRKVRVRRGIDDIEVRQSPLKPRGKDEE